MTYLWCIPYNWCNIGDHYRAHRRDIMVESEKKKQTTNKYYVQKKKKHQRECVSNETKTATTTTTKPKKKKTDRKSSIFPNVTISHCSCTPYRKDSWKKYHEKHNKNLSDCEDLAEEMMVSACAVCIHTLRAPHFINYMGPGGGTALCASCLSL